LAGQLLEYLASDIRLLANTERPQVWSASENACVIPRTYNNSFGDWRVSAVCPRVWNATPTYLRY